MLNFRTINITFALLLVVLIILDIFFGIPSLSYLLLAITYSLFLFYGSYYINSGFYLPVTCKAKTPEKKVAFSFDDGPATYTGQLLEILAAHHIKATFFCIGKNIEANKEMLKEVFEAGHIIGNHSYVHSAAFDFWSTKKVKADLLQTHQLVKSITGKNMLWFRPPFGVTNPNIAKATAHLNYKAIGWSIRSLDTVVKDKDALFKRVIAQLHPGAVILFHDICAVTVEMLPAFIRYVQQQDYEIIPMDKLLHLQPYAD